MTALDQESERREQRQTTARRLPALDGLRGVAALVVVMNHVVFTSAVVADAFVDPSAGHNWLATSSPLRLLFAGGEAVSTFFILSGLVLTLPFLDGGSWRRYYASRFLRLYLPVWAAVGLSVAQFHLIHRPAGGRDGFWMEAHAHQTIGMVARDLILVRGTNDSVLWSLQWEVIFSLLLPAFVFFGTRWRRGAVPKAVLCLLLIRAGGNHFAALRYLPMFALGVLIAVERDRLVLIALRFSRGLSRLLLCLALVLVMTPWIAPKASSFLPVHLAGLDASVVGCALIVALFACDPTTAGLTTGPIAQWLGRRSYSLYLVHEALVVSVAVLTHNLALTLVIGVPLALLASDLFYRFVEGPSHRLAQRVGRRVAASTQ
ncbi:MAG: hypothetical protein QOI02_1594 [Actinomycetota bacterium]|nr:hypothetical protein [Actinomycetota bacterium]